MNALSESMPYDPYGSAVAPAIVATFNDYYRQQLKVESDRPPSMQKFKSDLPAFVDANGGR
jgi:hypothetical protein